MSTTFDQTDITVTLKPVPDEHGECRRCHDSAEDCMCGRGSYYEMYAHDTQMMVCNLCGWGTHEGPCPLHAPREIPGLYLIPCDAVPPHGPTFIPQSEADHYAPCPWCQWHEAAARHEGCRHSHHRRWRSWRLTGRVVHVLSRLNLLTYTYGQGGGCPGCYTHIRFERVRRQRGWDA